VKFLIDTHILLWALTNDRRLTPGTIKVLRDSDNEVLVSAASLWEIGIKYANGRLPLPKAPGEYLPTALARTRFEVLPVLAEHAYAVADLPLHHKDPFDRLIIAQAKVEGVPVVSDDPWFKVYGVEQVG
jgi:PIN domain nuclease of toxin-antitoxin system